MQCQAKAKSTGQQCGRAAVNGKRVCTVHGGLTPGGIASPHWKTGRYSRYLPDRLSARFTESLTDPDLLELRAEIALTDGRLEDLLKRVDSGESGRAWSNLRDHYRQMQAEPDKRQLHLAAILKIIANDSYDYDAWREIHGLIEHRRRLVESENKRIKDMQNFYTAQQGMALMAAVVAAIKEHVHDRDTLQALSQTINRLVSVDAG